jgi:hypothetical protein
MNERQLGKGQPSIPGVPLIGGTISPQIDTLKLVKVADLFALG